MALRFIYKRGSINIPKSFFIMVKRERLEERYVMPFLYLQRQSEEVYM
jgi:hypothetical protein